ncbi:saccharopine dehydrogenase-like oxidoreductase [Dysidea avara]|uniref:saccharopine dehydrogenase-like oxidoreductase n=1 Tax=Dysidea avara TaxID=196820 RepID=UPI00331A9807
MSGKREFNITVFGATGFTGQYVAEELHRIQQEKGHEQLRWAMAGRSETKLKQVAEDLSLGDVECISADVNIQKSLNQMCMRSSVIINCVGPFQLYGEPVVRACIDQKCHYIDVSGETYFIEQMEQKYHQQAEEAGIFIVSACGFDSIPHDVGVRFTEESFSGKLDYIESFIEVFNGTGFNTGTWESFILSIANHSKLTQLRQKESKAKLPKGKRPPNRRTFHYNKTIKKWCVFFPGPDNAVVHRTQRYYYETAEKNPVNLKTYAALDSRFQSIMLSIGFLFIYLLSGFGWGRRLLMQFCGFFSGGMAKKGGPSKDKLKDTTFAITMFGSGQSDKSDEGDAKITTRVKGVEPGYIATSALLVQSALCMVDNRDQMPKCGGVYTPAVAFADTPLVENLKKSGKVVFEVVEPSP